ncbi:unnamed protein product [Cyprideis torosa]|uniref:Uncharacterized protein n=1 Tax=Cyprideis torosa TaxID=163714 RepID=A0A7R8W0J1_9CRUS|nr:unnamed protein product [Cyprideis torosa]CAG0879806.1 unnamed protein product [Cyprideis torosa]
MASRRSRFKMAPVLASKRSTGASSDSSQRSGQKVAKEEPVEGSEEKRLETEVKDNPELPKIPGDQKDGETLGPQQGTESKASLDPDNSSAPPQLIDLTDEGTTTVPESSVPLQEPFPDDDDNDPVMTTPPKLPLEAQPRDPIFPSQSRPVQPSDPPGQPDALPVSTQPRAPPGPTQPSALPGPTQPSVPATQPSALPTQPIAPPTQCITAPPQPTTFPILTQPRALPTQPSPLLSAPIHALPAAADPSPQPTPLAPVPSKPPLVTRSSYSLVTAPSTVSATDPPVLLLQPPLAVPHSHRLLVTASNASTSPSPFSFVTSPSGSLHVGLPSNAGLPGPPSVQRPGPLPTPPPPQIATGALHHHRKFRPNFMLAERRRTLSSCSEVEADPAAKGHGELSLLSTPLPSPLAQSGSPAGHQNNQEVASMDEPLRKKSSTGMTKMTAWKMEAQEKVRQGTPMHRLMMRDLITINPAGSPLHAPEEAAKKRKQAGNNRPSWSEAAGKKETTSVESPSEAPAPRIMIGPDGTIVLDEASLVVESSAQKRSKLMEESEALEIGEDDDLSRMVNPRKRPLSRRLDWNIQLTKKFYEALSTVGTDFSLMAQLLPMFARKELVSKYKVEQQKHPQLVEKALSENFKFDLSRFDSAIDDDDPEFILGVSSDPINQLKDKSKKRRLVNPIPMRSKPPPQTYARPRPPSLPPPAGSHFMAPSAPGDKPVGPVPVWIQVPAKPSLAPKGTLKTNNSGNSGTTRKPFLIQFIPSTTATEVPSFVTSSTSTTTAKNSTTIVMSTMSSGRPSVELTEVLRKVEDSVQPETKTQQPLSSMSGVGENSAKSVSVAQAPSKVTETTAAMRQEQLKGTEKEGNQSLSTAPIASKPTAEADTVKAMKSQIGKKTEVVPSRMLLTMGSKTVVKPVQEVRSVQPVPPPSQMTFGKVINPPSTGSAANPLPRPQSVSLIPVPETVVPASAEDRPQSVSLIPVPETVVPASAENRLQSVSLIPVPETVVPASAEEKAESQSQASGPNVPPVPFPLKKRRTKIAPILTRIPRGGESKEKQKKPPAPPTVIPLIDPQGQIAPTAPGSMVVVQAPSSEDPTKPVFHMYVCSEKNATSDGQEGTS